MQLKQLKLSGFKSFVDPTIVPFSSQLVAVLGPNGCGKSNIIDAVRWVMGEGSAKTLRGESMADVIFNGSSGRKPVGQASVELVFDNNMGRFSGQYASYQEIAIKRVVTRDGDSSYFLNGGRCRRRDITDLFLGTGAGTRGYSIIGQNTISQIVDAKPEELRAYFEEAAGVSKYKDRRRETQQRIQHTRENLARVGDICRELHSQLQRLERQAAAAKKYKLLKQEERECKSDILVLKWNALTQELQQKNTELSQLRLKYEEEQAIAASMSNRHAQLESERTQAQEAYQQEQTRFYQVRNEVTRLQDLQQQQIREQQQLKLDIEQATNDVQQAKSQLEQDTHAHQLSHDKCAQLKLHTEALASKLDGVKHILQEKQTQEASWNAKQRSIQSQLSQYQREMHVENLKVQHLEQRRQETMIRLEKAEAERALCVLPEEEAALNALQQQQNLAEEAYQQAKLQLQEEMKHGEVLRETLKDIEKQLRVAQDESQSHHSEFAAVQASLQASLLDMKPSASLLDSFQHHARLVEVIQVEETWRSACEWVLGESLHAITLDSLDSLSTSLSSFIGQRAVFVTSIATQDKTAAFPRLSDKVTGFNPAWHSSLENVFTADNLEMAYSWLSEIADHQSIITANGFWIGKGWVRIADFAKQDEASLLLRKAALAKLQMTLENALGRVNQLQQERNKQHELLAAHEKSQQVLIKQRDECLQLLQDINNRLYQKQHSIEQATLRTNRLQIEVEELFMQLETLAVEHMRSEEALVLARQQSEAYEKENQQLLSEKSVWDEALIASRTQVEEARTALHEASLQLNKEQLLAQQLSAAIVREQTRIDTLALRLENLHARCTSVEAPENATHQLLLQAIEQHQQLESALNVAHEKQEGLQIQLKEVHQVKLQQEQKIAAVQEQMVALQLAEQSCRARMDMLVEPLTELNIEPSSRMSELASELTLDVREQQLTLTVDKIKRLGAVNLVAIEEYETELARKTHLDEQSRDLNEALATLEVAIAKMDEETKSRLKETYEQVNDLFQALFPRLFGGGHARLQLTCDNLLEAGIVVMAQPPGKRNSSIQSLSGGEKAMTAVALVFAIFQLNPSPFCMLDEVDAPLDDLNVGRFCDLVKEMSQYVQFLLITHNKVTMELADHLIGVTMREPGVSRIVAVDVEEALSLVESE